MEGQELYELICARRSCRAYTEEQAPRDLLNRVLDAGRLAPSGMNVQQCHFIVVQRPELLEKLRVLIQQIFAGMDAKSVNPMLERAITLAKEGRHNFFYGAPTLIVVANKRENGNNLADSAAAMQNMMLMATALGLGNCWVNNLRWNGEAPPVRRFLEEIGVQEDEGVYGSLALGYAVTTHQEALPRTGNAVDIVD